MAGPEDEPAPEGPGDEGEAILLDHWIYGRPRTVGYRVMAVAEGLNLTLYEAKLRGHYTPLRGIVSDSVDRKLTDIRMVHPVADSDELLLSVLKPGLPDEAGRDTYVNHSVIAPMELLRSRRLLLSSIDEAVRRFDREQPGVEGTIAPLKVPLQEDPAQLPMLGAGLRKLLSKAAVENVASRWATVRDGRTLLYLPGTEDAVRVDVLYQLLEVLCIGGKLPVPVSMSDVPPVSQLDAFQVIVSPRGIRADQRWALVEANVEKADAPRNPKLSSFYAAIDTAYKPTPRIVGGPPKRPGPTSSRSTGPGPPEGGGDPSDPESPSSPSSPEPPPSSLPRSSSSSWSTSPSSGPSSPAPRSAPSSPGPHAPSSEPRGRGPATSPPARAPPTPKTPEPAPATPVPSVAAAPPSLEEAHRRVGDAFHGFVGNTGAIERISIDLVSALTSSPPRLASSYLITGNPSTGKTTLAQTMARALGVPLVLLDGQSVSDRDTLIEAVGSTLRAQGTPPRTLEARSQGMTEYEYPPVLVFIDEVQLVPRRTQEALLTLTEPDTRFVRLDSGIHRFPYATFVAATTRPQAVDRALRSRFSPEVHLNDYTREEVAEIVARRYPQMPKEICARLATLGQLIPRVALRLAHDLAARQKVSLDRERALSDHLADLERSEELDALGFGPVHRKVLSLLKAQDGPVGLDTLLNLLGESDRLYVEREILAGLQRAGLVSVQTTGRTLTPEGVRYLESASSPPGGKGELAEAGPKGPGPTPPED